MSCCKYRGTALGLMLAACTAAAQDAAPVQDAPTAAAEESAAELAPVVVTGEATDRDGYTTGAVSIGKSVQSIRETPQSVTVITRQRLDDQNITSIPEALSYATGVNVQRFDGAGYFNSYNVRGYQVDSIVLDGVSFGNTGNVVELDAAAYERVEILRGPAGLFLGAGEPSAAINLVRKRALRDAHLGGALGVGRWDAYRAEVDGGTPLNKSGSLRGRAVVVYDDRDSYQDVIGSSRKLFYGTLEYDFTRSTTLSVGYSRQEIDSVINQGLAAYPDGELPEVPRSTFIGADWNRQLLDTNDIFAELEHWLDDGGQIKVAVRKLDRFMLYRVARANSAVKPDGTVDIQTGQYSPDRDAWGADAYASLPFDWFGRRHNLIVGADWRQSQEVAKSSPFTVTGIMDVFNPDHDFPQPDLTYNSRSRTDISQYGTYSQLRFKALDDLSLVGGARLTWWKSRNVTAGTDYDASAELTPYAAALYDLTSQLTVYTSYASIFVPQNAKRSNGEQIKPRSGDQYEAGIKAEFLHRRLNTQFAVFRMEDQNRALTDPNDDQFSVPAGKVRSQGFEMEAAGRLLSGWDLSLGYTYVDTQYLKGTAAQDGTSFAPFTPMHTGTLWTRYAFAGGVLDGFSLGGGVRAMSSFYATSGAVRLEEAAVTLLDAALGYQFNQHWSANLSGRNLLDEKYYQKLSGFGRQNFYGEPLNFMLTLRVSY